MKHLDWYDYLRIITCILSLASLYQLSLRAYHFWGLYTSYLKDIWYLLFGFQLLLIEGGIESIITNVPGGPRIVISFFLSAICLRVTFAKDATFLKSWSQVEDYTDPRKSAKGKKPH